MTSAKVLQNRSLLTAAMHCLSRGALPALGIIAMLSLWEFLIVSPLLNERYIPRASTMVAQLSTEMVSGSTWFALRETLTGTGISLALSMVVAIPAGIFIGSNAVAYRATRVGIEFMRPVPSVALVPLAVLLYGSSMESKVFLATFASFWLLLMQAIYGVRSVNVVSIDTARVYGLRPLEVLFRVKLPSSLPYILTGVRLAATVSLLLCVTAEIVIGAAGIGRTIRISSAAGDYPRMYALVVLTGVLGLGLNGLTSQLERRALHWHVSQRVDEM